MPLRCCIKKCKLKKTKGSPITFHKFPKEPIRRSQWVKNIGRKNFISNNGSKVCSNHFEADCFDHENVGGTRLKSTAVPTLFSCNIATTTEAKSLLVQDISSSQNKNAHVPVAFSAIEEESGDSSSETELVNNSSILWCLVLNSSLVRLANYGIF